MSADIYVTSAEILQQIWNKKGTIKSLCLAPHVQHKKKTYALVSQTIKYAVVLRTLLHRTKLLQKDTRLTTPLAHVLLYDAVLSERRALRCGGWMKYVVRAAQPDLDRAMHAVLAQRGLADVQGLLTATPASVVRPRYARVNTLKTTLDACVACFEAEGWAFVGTLAAIEPGTLSASTFGADPLLPTTLLVFPPGTDLHDHPLTRSGQLVLQDKASCLPAHVLAPPATAHCIDACAAPGNKTSYLSQHMHNTGHITAFERDAERHGLLCSRLAHLGCTNVDPRCADFLATDPLAFPDVTHVLVDPSCSGSGIHTESARVPAARLRRLAGFQQKMVLHAMQFPNAQRIVYSTCSVNVEENENVVRAVLAQQPRFVLARDLLPMWPDRGRPGAGLAAADAARLVRLGPHAGGTHGFFIAMFERASPEATEEATAEGAHEASKPAPAPAARAAAAAVSGKRRKKMKPSQRKSIIDR